MEFDRLHNFRDMGGYTTADGRAVRWGRLYRADALSNLAGADWDRFRALGVRTVIDLRFPAEIGRAGRIPEHDGITYHNLSIEHRSWDRPELDRSIDPARFLADRYAEIVADGLVELREVLEVIAGTGDAPLVFHCASGKDRTGVVAALVLSLLGIAERDIVADFALTGLATDRLIADWRAAHPDRPITWPGHGQAPADAMRLFLAELTRDHGSVRGYVIDRLGCAQDLIPTLQTRFLAPAHAA